MKLVLMGTGPFAGPAFAALMRHDQHEVLALITRPEAPARKGRKGPPPNPMRQLAESHTVPVHAPDSINSPEAIALLMSLEPDLLVVCDYGQILKPAALATAPLGGINLHGSLLPKYRGAAPVHWAIWNGDPVTGVTVIHMTPQLDGGPCLTSAETAIGEDETTEQLEPRLAALGVAPVLEALELLANHGEGQLGELQDPALTTKAPRLTKHDGLLDWALPAERLYCQFRALQPWPGVYTFAPHAKHPIRIIVQQMRVVSEHDESQPPGAVAYNDSQTLRVATGRGEIELIRVQPAGKREMEIAEFLRGHALPIGTRLGEE
ncbi:MAG: methionyl-tRNA formyltransferase [Planctomycetales bacterium]|nr:methionyl-tRNA formyltransferase [Planctomycetales bacterium]